MINYIPAFALLCLFQAASITFAYESSPPSSPDLQEPNIDCTLGPRFIPSKPAPIPYEVFQQWIGSMSGCEKAAEQIRTLSEARKRSEAISESIRRNLGEDQSPNGPFSANIFEDLPWIQVERSFCENPQLMWVYFGLTSVEPPYLIAWRDQGVIRKLVGTPSNLREEDENAIRQLKLLIVDTNESYILTNPYLTFVWPMCLLNTSVNNLRFGAGWCTPLVQYGYIPAVPWEPQVSEIATEVLSSVPEKDRGLFLRIAEILDENSVTTTKSSESALRYYDVSWVILYELERCYDAVDLLPILEREIGPKTLYMASEERIWEMSRRIWEAAKEAGIKK